jgi:hypothetical protein
MYFFTSPTPNMPVSDTTITMTRVASCDSTASAIYSSKPLLAEDIRPRSSSSFSSTDSASSNHHSSSSCTFLPSPYRSSFQHTARADEPSSYLSDDDLLAPFTYNESTANTTPKRNLSTEEQIEMVRQYAARALELGQNPYGGWKQTTQAKEKRSRVVRFAGEETMSAR